MREIKFRAWDEDGHMIYPPFNLTFFNEQVTLVEPSGTIGLNGSAISLMQFTGLLDKNGKEIYEGDIVKCGEHYSGDHLIPEIVHSVIFEEGEFCLDSLKGYIGEELIWLVLNKELEVVGNVFECSGLVKEGETNAN